MSFNCVNYIKSFLKNYDEYSEKVSLVLLENEWVSLKQLKNELKPIKAAKILIALEKLNNLGLCTKSIDPNEQPTVTYYDIDHEACIHFPRNSMVMDEIGLDYNEDGKRVMKLFSSKGNQSIIDVVKAFSLSSDSDKLRQFLDMINRLVSDGLLELSPVYCDKFLVEVGTKNLVNVPEVIKKVTQYAQKGKRKISALVDDESDSSWNVSYRVNKATIGGLIQQKVILAHVETVCSPESFLVMKAVMAHYEKRPDEELSINELRGHVKLDQTVLQDALYELSEADPHLVYVEVRGDSVLMNLHSILESLIVLELSQILLIRHGNEAVKVFNYLVRNPFVDEKDLEKLFMGEKIKWADLLTLLCNSFFISKREISKSRTFTDQAPLEIYYFVDLQKVTRSYLVEQAYVSLKYVNEAYDAMLTQNAVLLEKMNFVKFVVTNGTTADSNGDISTITEIEQNQMDSLNVKLKKLKSWEVSLHNSLVIYESYLEYRKMTNF